MPAGAPGCAPSPCHCLLPPLRPCTTQASPNNGSLAAMAVTVMGRRAAAAARRLAGRQTLGRAASAPASWGFWRGWLALGSTRCRWAATAAIRQSRRAASLPRARAAGRRDASIGGQLQRGRGGLLPDSRPMMHGHFVLRRSRPPCSAPAVFRHPSGSSAPRQARRGLRARATCRPSALPSASWRPNWAQTARPDHQPTRAARRAAGMAGAEPAPPGSGGGGGVPAQRNKRGQLKKDAAQSAEVSRGLGEGEEVVVR